MAKQIEEGIYKFRIVYRNTDDSIEVTYQNYYLRGIEDIPQIKYNIEQYYKHHTKYKIEFTYRHVPNGAE
jgi:hypothetical protein